MATVILHDTRLHGIPESELGTVVTVNATTPLADGLNSATRASVQSGTELAIACHGYMTHSYDNASNTELRGGQGLQLCRESLLVDNVNAASALSGYFSRIWLMACGPAGTLVHTSRPFCRELAHYANTPVIASDTAQRYHPGTYDEAARISRQVLRFGNWEGNVYLFTPDGNVTEFTSGETPMP
jgi:hypothetical protein